MGSSSISFSLANIWKSWYLFRRGKKSTVDLERFNYYLEENLHDLFIDLNSGRYQHGPYRQFTVYDNKKRQISVAFIRDRVIHRLVYEYLTKIYDKTFIYDAWSCRKEKGLVGAIERTQQFLTGYPESFVWRADIKKFFDNVDHEVLLKILFLKISDQNALALLRKIIESYSVSISERESNELAPKGVPIGNLTSQIFANIYLNELDRFVKYQVKPLAYLRYGDDFIVLAKKFDELENIRERIKNFAWEKLQLEINSKHDIMIKTKQGLKFLGTEIFPASRNLIKQALISSDELDESVELGSRRLNKRNWRRANSRLNFKNISSYSGLIKKHNNAKRIRYFNWVIFDKLIDGQFF